MLADLGPTRAVRDVTPTIIRTSNCYAKQCKTNSKRPRKHQSECRATSANIEARAFYRTSYTWYNGEHRHSRIAFLTPSNVHHGRVADKTRQRKTKSRCCMRRTSGTIRARTIQPASAHNVIHQSSVDLVHRSDYYNDVTEWHDPCRYVHQKGSPTCCSAKMIICSDRPRAPGSGARPGVQADVDASRFASVRRYAPNLLARHRP
jgi:hypothetical protein